MPSQSGSGALAGRVAVVTGGVKGIGAAIVERLAADGARVAVLDRDAPSAGQPIAASAQVDVSDYAAVGAAFRRFADELGPIDILVNNAGWDRVQPFLDNEPQLWDTLVRINLIGVFNTIHTVLPMMKGRGGRIINIASDAGRVGSSGEAV